MSDDDYVVAVKPSARRANATVGRIVVQEGTRQTFDSRPLADGWARGLSQGGGGRVWVRDANPNDDDDVDGYLVSSNRVPVGERAAMGPLSTFLPRD